MKFIKLVLVILIQTQSRNDAVYQPEFKQTERRTNTNIVEEDHVITYNNPDTLKRSRRNIRTDNDAKPQCSGSGKYSAASCGEYYECERVLWWWEAFLKFCPDGEGYDPELEQCNRDGLIKCLNQFTTTTTTTTTTPVPSESVTPVSSILRQTEIFASTSTEASSLKPTISLDFPHDSILECSGHAKHPAILCNMYFECDSIFELFWIPNLKTCPNGQAFDSRVNECNHEALANCADHPSVTTATPQPNKSEISVQNASVVTMKPSTSNSEILFNKAKVPDCSGPGKYPAELCNQYYECEETRFMLFVSWWDVKLKTCPNGKAFDRTIDECSIAGLSNCPNQSETNTTNGEITTHFNLELFVSTDALQNTSSVATNSPTSISSNIETNTVTTSSSFEPVNVFNNLLNLPTESVNFEDGQNTTNVSFENTSNMEKLKTTTVIPNVTAISSVEFFEPITGSNVFPKTSETSLENSTTTISTGFLNSIPTSQNITNALETSVTTTTVDSITLTPKSNFSDDVSINFDKTTTSTQFLQTVNESVFSEFVTNEDVATPEIIYSKSNDTTTVTESLSLITSTLAPVHFLFNPNKNNITLINVNSSETIPTSTQNFSEANSETAVTTTSLSVFSSEQVDTSDEIALSVAPNIVNISTCSTLEKRPGPSCNQYYQCIPVLGHYKLETCSYGQAFDSEFKECKGTDLINCNEAFIGTTLEVLEYSDVTGDSPKTVLALTTKIVLLVYYVMA